MHKQLKLPLARELVSFLDEVFLFEEDCFVTHYEDVKYYEGQYIGYITANPFGEFNTVTGISFFNEVIPTPTITACAECQVNQAAQREQVVTYEEVFKVKYAGTFTHRLEIAPNVEAQYARHGQKDDCEGANFDGFFTRPFGQFANHTNDVFEYCDYSRECCEEHKQEEQGAPEVTACHGVEYVRQSYEEQTRTAARIYTEAHASREDNQAGGDCYESIQCHNPHGFTSQGLVFFNVRTKDCHGADTQGQGKEGLTHCCENSFLVNFAEVRKQVEFQAFCAIGEHNGVCSQNYNQYQKASHHIFGNAFYAFLYAQVANAHTSCSHENHVEGHCNRVAEECAEHAADSVSIKAHQVTYCHFVQVVGHPTGNGGVEHHQYYVAGDGSVFEQVPFGSFRFQNVKGFCRTALACTTNGEFCYHDGQAQDEQED